MFARIAGASRKTRPQVRVLGAYRQVHNVFALVGGAWRPAWSYTWDAGPWGNCSVTCGGGTQTRTVRCLRSDGEEMADAFCSQAGAKPTASQSCNTQPCYTYAWNWGSWGSCNASCGWGTRSRSVWCQRSDGASVATSYCQSYSKPATSESCYAGSCVQYYWDVTFSGSCSTKCGTGTQSGTLTCMGDDGKTYSNSACSGISKPSTQRSCTSCIDCFPDLGGAYLRNKLKHVQDDRSEPNQNYGSLCPSVGLPQRQDTWNIGHLEKFITQCHNISIYTHYSLFSEMERVCPYASTICCKQKGYIWY